jgi:hypothetical protein
MGRLLEGQKELSDVYSRLVETSGGVYNKQTNTKDATASRITTQLELVSSCQKKITRKTK